MNRRNKNQSKNTKPDANLINQTDEAVTREDTRFKRLRKSQATTHAIAMQVLLFAELIAEHAI